MAQIVSIRSIASVSSLGDNPEKIWTEWQKQNHLFQFRHIGNTKAWGGFLDSNAREQIEILRESSDTYKHLDDSVLLAIAASRQAVEKAGWNSADTFGINIGSSRGATSLFEKHHEEFLQTGKAPLLTSPVTTLGNISSWVAQDLASNGPELSHSITCSTSLHALLNGVAWLRSGMADKFLVGGSESPLTAFTISQMQSLKIYSREPETAEFPSRALEFDKKFSSMILGEAASMCCLESGVSDESIAIVESVGYATETLESNTSISANADCLQRSMKMALSDIHPSEIDVIIMHAPGTVKGDFSEFRAIEAVFGNHKPLLTTTKWKNGHTFGASGMINVELAALMLQHQYFIGSPFGPESKPVSLKKILVNAVGFGGNAVSAVISIF
ncbi:beta-ketoacyl synthase N-terminal-like domain-containing protein [Flavobacterium silvaticum]|uniref:Beta-ketoacyl synthase n=1 Tax=Flavobacterium silvaticum TaxID=1852020 RepID=A0A972FUF9_9FLAO|nr:beta-ketoacyl synthase N-terminal-like domain-containing protein [Flavobacterium silvaticum]NMH28237.1 beta-ketoacyl synthase [Flavobacterium silvaticum]